MSKHKQKQQKKLLEKTGKKTQQNKIKDPPVDPATRPATGRRIASLTFRVPLDNISPLHIHPQPNYIAVNQFVK